MGITNMIYGLSYETLDQALNGCGLKKTEAVAELRALLDATRCCTPGGHTCTVVGFDYAAPGTDSYSSVRKHGAVSDGATDDTAAFQSAVDAPEFDTELAAGNSLCLRALCHIRAQRHTIAQRDQQIAELKTLVEKINTRQDRASHVAVVQGKPIVCVLGEECRCGTDRAGCWNLQVEA